MNEHNVQKCCIPKGIERYSIPPQPSGSLTNVASQKGLKDEFLTKYKDLLDEVASQKGLKVRQRMSSL